VRAEGALLQRLVAATPPTNSHGLRGEAFKTFEAAQSRTEWALRHRRRYALVDGSRLLAAATRYDLAGRLDQRPVSICGLDAVFDGPDHADGDGAAETLVERLLQDATRDGADLALAFGDFNATSRRLPGFEAVPFADVELTVADSSRHGAPMTTVRSGADRDLAAIAEMGRGRARPFRLHLERDVDLVKNAITRTRLLAGLAPAGTRQLEFVVAEEGITAAAYVVISVFDGRWTVEECGDRDDSGARVGALLQALIAREPAETPPVIRGWLPAGFVPPQITIASTPPATTLLVRVLSAHARRLNLSSADVLYWRSDMF
jgi:hypothetical protein